MNAITHTSRHVNRLLTAAALIAAVLLFRPAAPRATAQIPELPRGLTLFSDVSTDGQGIVLTWSISLQAFFSDGFVVLRRIGSAPAGSGTAIASLPGNVKAYTDYSVPGAGIWCYQVVSTYQGNYTYSSPESCTGFLPGLPGNARPVIAAGCNEFYQTLPAGTPAATVAAHFDPPSAVTSIWRYDPVQQRQLSGYFKDTGAPTDFSVLPATGELEYVCLSAPATYR